MIDGIERFVFGDRQGAGSQNTNEQAADEARALSDGYGINLRPKGVRLRN